MTIAFCAAGILPLDKQLCPGRHRKPAPLESAASSVLPGSFRPGRRDTLAAPQSDLSSPLYIVFVRSLRHKRRKITENYANFLKKGIDFMESLRYNWSVHEQKYLQEV